MEIHPLGVLFKVPSIWGILGCLNLQINKRSKQLTELLNDEIAASTSSSDEKVTNPYPLDFEVPGTRETLALRTFPFSEKKFLRVSVVTVLARFPTYTLWGLSINSDSSAWSKGKSGVDKGFSVTFTLTSRPPISCHRKQ